MDEGVWRRLLLVYFSRFLEALEQARSIRDAAPIVVFLYSAGKDSAAAMLPYLVEWFSDLASMESWVDALSVPEIHVVHVVVTGNSHPANTYCATASMLSTLRHMRLYTPELYHAELLASDRVFQWLAAKYGLVIGPRRWCFLEFKYKVIYNYLERLWHERRQPLIVVDGMSPSDRAQRSKAVRKPVEIVETSRGFSFVALHPLYGLEFDRLALIEWVARRFEPFRYYRCVVELYRVYGDSMNCILCPYKQPQRLLRNLAVDPALKEAVAGFIEVALRGEHWQRYAKHLRTPPITNWSERGSSESTNW